MKILIVFSALAVVVFAAPQGYSLTAPSGSGLQPGLEFSSLNPTSAAGDNAPITAGLSYDGEQSATVGISTNDGAFTETVQTTDLTSTANAETGVSALKDVATSNEVSTADSNGTAVKCKDGEIRHIDGSCVVPVITRKVFVFNVPQQESEENSSLPELPPPKVEHNILFVRLPEAGEGPEPIIVPPPRQNNIVYVLNKQNEQTQRVIEVPAPPPSEPEIYFVDYEEGENPTLPGGVDLLTALGSASETGGEVVGVIDHDTNEDITVGNSTEESTTSETRYEESDSNLSGDEQVSSSANANIISENTTGSGIAAPSGIYTTP